MFFTNRQNDWMKKIWGVSRRQGAPSETPGKVLSEIRPIFDGLGWLNLEEVESEIVTGAAQAQRVDVAQVPAGTTRLYLRGTIEHNDVAGTKQLWLEINLSNVELPINGSILTSAFNPSTLSALPLPVKAGDNLVIVSGTGLSAATNIIGNFLFVDIAIGSYIPGVSL